LRRWSSAWASRRTPPPRHEIIERVGALPASAAAAALIASLTIVWTAAFGIVHFGDPALPIGERIVGVQAAILGVALCAYVLAALFAEQRQAAVHQRLLIAELDHHVKSLLARLRLSSCRCADSGEDGRVRQSARRPHPIDGERALRSCAKATGPP
jgi:hypothetical protein